MTVAAEDGGVGPAATPGPMRAEVGHKRIRALLAGELVADSVRPVLVWERPQYPTYYLPAEDVVADLVPTGRVEHSPQRGDGEVLDVRVAGAVAPGGARRYPGSPVEQIRALVRLEWGLMTEWLEEDEPVYTHPRDPYTRVDILASSRHVRVEVDGVIFAESSQPRILFETGLPPRYYLPLAHFRAGFLQPSASATHCPYKGAATYWSVDTGRGLHRDLVWMYRSPFPEAQKIAGLASFYNERVDLFVDGTPMDRPRTHFN